MSMPEAETNSRDTNAIFQYKHIECPKCGVLGTDLLLVLECNEIADFHMESIHGLGIHLTLYECTQTLPWSERGYMRIKKSK